MDATTIGKLSHLTAMHPMPLLPLHAKPTNPHFSGFATRMLPRGVYQPVTMRRRGDVRVASRMFGLQMEPEVEQRMAEGTMNFDDFMKVMVAMNKMRRLEKKADAEQLNAVAEKMAAFSEVTKAFAEEERSEPDLLFGDSARERVERIAESSGQNQGIVDRFLYEFKMMREMEKRLAKGENFEDLEADLRLEAFQARTKTKMTAVENPPRAGASAAPATSATHMSIDPSVTHTSVAADLPQGPLNRAQRRMQKKKRSKSSGGPGGFAR
eukprot:gnl/TRDRNA2_/TRDRNA2_81186_c1_seq1.p1 gnl/TRDRNA2_/TRDRNA2_81186_c1~~gnl/TRDRNA2_/TRDRNA2_81186_c1_seq1.p1  ORF type:complete len:299 (+),score=60.94 gnl/TRDRNA2_/TRDRNA2_81186_c1_seq1:95-898(+)